MSIFIKNLSLKISIILICLINCLAQGQVSDLSFITSRSYKLFEQHQLTNVEAYQIKVNNRGKVKKDSVLLYQYNYNKTQRRIYGTDHDIIVNSHGPMEKYFYSFENFFDKGGNIIRAIQYRKNNNENEDYLDENVKDVTEYDYSGDGDLIKETSFLITTNLGLFGSDSIISIKPIMKEFTYRNRKKTAEFFTRDSTITYVIAQQNKVSSKDCVNCEPRYKTQEWEYNNNGCIQRLISYARNGDFHTKSYYLYDFEKRLVKQIDSTGWYINVNPFIESIITTVYLDSTKVVTKVDEENLFQSHSKNIKVFDLKDNLISDYTYSGNYIFGIIYLYNSKDQLINEVRDYNGRKSFTTYIYNPDGLIMEKRTKVKDKLVELEKYYYYNRSKIIN